MKYENKLSKLRHLALKVQGQDLKQVLLRAAAERAEGIAKNVHTVEEIFHELKDKIYLYTNEMPWDECYNIVSDAAELNTLKGKLIDEPSTKFEWAETLHVLLDGTEGTERNILNTVLTNQYNYAAADAAYPTSLQNLGGFLKILVPIVRRIFTNFEVGKLVGVQPMSGPVGLSYLLRYKQEEIKEEIKEEPVTEIDSDKLKDIKLGGTSGRKMTLEIITQAVEAATHRLQAGWTLEAAQDLNAIHGLDIESEMSQAIASEIQAEITMNIIYDVRRLAGKPIEIEVDGFKGEDFVALSCEINKACNDIARKTRRGAGNWIVVPYTTAVMLEEQLKSTYVKSSDKKPGLYGTLMEVGILNGSIKVFTSFDIPSDEILVGYKGRNGATDAGYVYCPYIPVLSSGVVVNPETFQPIVSLMTRAGTSLNGWRDYDEDGNEIDKGLLTCAKDYYNLIKIKGNLFTLKDTTDEA